MMQVRVGTWMITECVMQRKRQRRCDRCSECYSSIGVSCQNQKSLRKYRSTWKGMVWRRCVCVRLQCWFNNCPNLDVTNMVLHVLPLCLIFPSYLSVLWDKWMSLLNEGGECGSVTSGSTSRHISTGGGISNHGQAFFQRPPANTRPTSSMLYSCRG